MQPLGRVLDPEALDDCRGVRAQLRIEVAADWLTAGATLLITCPRRLQCARCDGGGCDECERSGAYRSPSDEEARLIETQLPAGDGSGVIVRLAAPFEESDIEQLLLKIHPGASPSACVERLARFDLQPAPVSRGQLADHPQADRVLLIGWLVIVVLSAVAIALLR